MFQLEIPRGVNQLNYNTIGHFPCKSQVEMMFAKPLMLTIKTYSKFPSLYCLHTIHSHGM